MKKFLISLLLVASFCATSESQSFYGHAKVSVTKGFLMAETTWLDFGNVTATSSGTVSVSPTGVVTSTGGVVEKGSVSPSIFTVVAMPNSAFVVTLPTTCTLSSGSNQLYVTNFTSTLTDGVGMTDANGSASVAIGGKLTIPTNFVYGNYSGGFEIIASYQ